MKYRRINIIGAPGPGKSTLAKKLAKICDLPVVHLDKIAHTDAYNPRLDKPAFVEKVKEEAQAEKWIIEGVYKYTLDFRVPAADLTIYLDLPRPVYVYRVLKRRLQYHNKVRDEMPEGWVERIEPEFFKYTLYFHRDQKPIIEAKLAKYPDANIVTLRSTKEVKDFLKKLG